MKLNPKEFKRFKELEALVKSKKASAAEEAEYNTLAAKKNKQGSNDPKWWLNYPELAKSVTNLPFNYIPGTAFPLRLNDSGDNFAKFANVVLIKVIETIGKSSASTDPINTQIRQLWLDLHRKYRGIGTYEQSDLGMAILAIRSCFNTIAKFERIYGVINSYHVGNRSVPYALKEALRISSDLEEHLADFRYLLNFNIEKLRQLCLPKGLSALDADIIMFSNVFKDSENRRASLFVFDNDTFGVYDPELLSTGGCVKYFKYSTQMSGGTESGNDDAFTLSDIKKILDTCVNALLTDEDIARICSDLLAAYGPENVMTLSLLEENYRVEPVHDAERLLQMHNATFVGNVAFGIDTGIKNALDAYGLYQLSIDNIIYQKDNVIHNELATVVSNQITAYAVEGDYAYPGTTSVIEAKQARTNEVLFDTWVDAPNEGDIMVGTRLTTIAGGPTHSGSTLKCQILQSWGTIVATEMLVYSYDATNKVFYSGPIVTYSYATSMQNELVKLSQVDWAPMFYVVVSGNMSIYGDVDNFTTISGANLARIHEVAILSGFKFSQVTHFEK